MHDLYIQLQSNRFASAATMDRAQALSCSYKHSFAMCTLYTVSQVPCGANLAEPWIHLTVGHQRAPAASSIRTCPLRNLTRAPYTPLQANRTIACEFVQSSYATSDFVFEASLLVTPSCRKPRQDHAMRHRRTAEAINTPVGLVGLV